LDANARYGSRGGDWRGPPKNQIRPVEINAAVINWTHKQKRRPEFPGRRNSEEMMEATHRFPLRRMLLILTPKVKIIIIVQR